MIGGMAALLGASGVSGVAFAPADLGTVASWFGNDDTDISYQVTGSPVVTNVTDQGSFAGQWDAGTNQHPVAVGVDARSATAFRQQRRVASSIASSNWTFLHDSVSSGSVVVRIYIYEIASDSYILTNTTGASAEGITLLPNTDLTNARLIVGDGTTFMDLKTTTANLTVGWNTFSIRKVGTTVYLGLNGGAEASATIANVTTTAAGQSMTLGNYYTGDFACDGVISEVIFYQLDVGTSGISSLATWLAGRWIATPDDAAIQYAGLYSDIDFGKAYTLNSGNVSAINDLSGLNEHLAQGTAGAQLAHTLSDATFNGRGSVQGASGDYISRATWLSGAHSNPTTQYLVVETPASVSTDQYITRGATARNDVYLNNAASGDPAMYGGGALGAGAKHMSTVQIIIATFNGATLSRIQIHAEGQTVVSVTGNGGTTAGNGRHIGGFAAVKNFTGKISRVLDYDADYNSDVLDMLTAEYAITTA